MQIYPHFPLHANVASLLGLTLLLGLIGGKLAKQSPFLPIISGYIAVGFLVGPGAFNIVTPSLLSGANKFIDIALGFILFALGRHLHIRWLQHDLGILKMAMTESCLTFIFVFMLFSAFHFPWLHAALAATIAIATSPAVIMMVADEFSSKGPVTRRTLILTSLNNLFAILLFNILLPMTLSDKLSHLIVHISYRLFGSILLSTAIFVITLGVAYFIGKRKENQLILLIGCMMFAIGLADILQVSSMLTLFTLGVSARNFNYKGLLIEVEFGWLAKLFLVLLFVITGIHLQIKGLWETTLIVLAFLLIRTLTKSFGVWTFAKTSQLTSQQAWSLCFALTPMAGLAVGMSNVILYFNSELGNQLMTIITTAIAILNIFGPIAVHRAFIKSNEVIAEIKSY